MAGKHIKMRWKSLVFGEMQIKTTTRYHYELITMTKSKRLHVGKDAELQLCYTDGKKYNAVIILETGVDRFLQREKYMYTMIHQFYSQTFSQKKWK